MVRGEQHRNAHHREMQNFLATGIFISPNYTELHNCQQDQIQ